MAMSYLAEQSEMRIVVSDVNKASTPKSAGVYSRVSKGETNREIACANEVPDANNRIDRPNSPRGRNELRRFFHQEGALWAMRFVSKYQAKLSINRLATSRILSLVISE